MMPLLEMYKVGVVTDVQLAFVLCEFILIIDLKPPF